MPDNFVHSLCTHACRKAENLPSFCSGMAKSQLRQNGLLKPISS